MKILVSKEKIINVIKTIIITFVLVSSSFTFGIEKSDAYPVYAQQAYANPREANGRIACANCHLAQKPVGIEAPSGVLPDSVFEAVIKVPYDKSSKQVLSNGQLGGLNVGAVVVLPEGFKLAPANRLNAELKEKTKGVFISPYSSTQDNILVVGPILGDTHQEIVFPILSPDPATNKSIHFIKYPIYVGANRGRGQIYPTGEKSNNSTVLANASGQITELSKSDKGETFLTIVDTNGKEVKQTIPKGLVTIVSEKDIIKSDQVLTKDPNVGGFGQTDTEIVLQSPARIYGFMAFTLAALLTQILLVIKKKQFEKVQAAELNF
ncbi:unnamed protein product [Chrysoparadoxa australica]